MFDPPLHPGERVPVEDFAFRFGIEEEFFLVRPGTGRLVARAPERLLADLRRQIGPQVTSELLQSQIEIASPILGSAGEARERLPVLRRQLAAALAPHGLAPLAAGTHPLGQWREQTATDTRRYRRLLDDFQIVARRNLVCGMHVHVELPDDVDRVRVMNRLMPWLPLFLALSTSSPFWDRQRTGLLGYRQSMYDEWPRTGIPDHFEDQAAYDAFTALLQRAGAIRDAGSLWWGIRPARRFPTLELRIADACTRVDDALAIAAVFRCLVRRSARDPAFGAIWSPITRRVIDENRWRAKRWGLQATFLREQGDPVAAGTWLQQLRDACRDDIKALDCAAEWAHAASLPQRGSSAHEQLAIYHAQRERGASRAQALQSVVRWLLDTTVQQV